MKFLIVFAIMIPVFILSSLISGEILMMNQLNKTHSNITWADDPVGFLFSIAVLLILEFYLIKTIRSGKESD